MDTEGRGGERGSRVTLARRRAYSLLDGSTFIVVNHTVRLDGLQFTAAKGGPQQQNAPLGGAPQALLYMYYISRDTHTSIGACCSESQEE